MNSRNVLPVKNEKFELLEKYPEFLDVMDIVIYGRNKHKNEGWLERDGYGMSKKENFASLNRHLAKWYSGGQLDEDSKYHHLLHVACRALMEYTRYKRHIIHSVDQKQHDECIKLRAESRHTGIDDSNCVTMEEHHKNMKQKKSKYYFNPDEE